MTVEHTIVVDPSVRSAGVAYFRGGRLTAVAGIKLLSVAERAEKCVSMTHKIVAWARGYVGANPVRVVVEWPQVYRTAKSKGDPNDLLGLAGVCVGVASALNAVQVVSYTPAEWEPAPKVSDERKRKKLGPIDSEAFTSPRGLRVMSRLTDGERIIVPLSHDAVDAIGIGLHDLHRLDRVRVFPGATP